MENIFNRFLLKYFNKSIIFWLLYTFLSVVLDAHLSDQKVGAVCRIFRHLQGTEQKLDIVSSLSQTYFNSCLKNKIVESYIVFWNKELWR